MRVAMTVSASPDSRAILAVVVKFASHNARQFARAAVAALVLALASLGLAAPAQAAPAQAAPVGIEFSADGITFSPVFSGSLFTDIAIAVPGDHQSSSFWVRNTSAAAGYLRVILADVVASGPAIADAITVQSSTPAFEGTAAPLSSAKPCWILLEGDLVPAGSAVKVTSTLAFGNLTGTVGQNETATLSLGVGMSDAAVGALPPSSCIGASAMIPLSGSPVKLATTGSETPYSLLALSAGALGIGLFFLVAAKRRRREET